MSDGWGRRLRRLRRRTLFAGAVLAVLLLVGGGLAIYLALLRALGVARPRELIQAMRRGM